MRVSRLILIAAAVIGCGRIDSSRSNPNVDTSAPAMSRSGDVAPGPAAPTNDATTPVPAASGAPATTASPATTGAAGTTGATDRTGAAATTTARQPADAAAGESAASTAPDNTAVNARDTNRSTREPKLPIDQKENQADIDLTSKIRQQVLKIDGLSVNGRNCKIITSDGRVTLRGPVNSATERDQIAKIAREIAGDDKVDDQLEVAAANR